MVVVSTRYEFSQHFNAPAAEAFAWCTDYDPKDHNLMGLKGFRKVTRVSDDTILLEDTLYPNGKATTKKKLIKTDKERTTYFNLHLTGPNKNSLYFYRIIPEGPGPGSSIRATNSHTRRRPPARSSSLPLRKPTQQLGRRSGVSSRRRWRGSYAGSVASPPSRFSYSHLL